MPIFISYSRSDESFATELASQLVRHRARVWIDQWEIHVGDSLVDKIQAAVEGATALLIILSKASVESEWVKRELSAALLRELEEKRVIVLPVLMEECDIPLFLRGKLYADFREDFDKGLESVLAAVARVTSDSLGRAQAVKGHIDWSIDWAVQRGFLVMTLTVVEQVTGQPYTILTQIQISANRTASDRHAMFEAAGIGWIERAAVVESLVAESHEEDLRILIEDERPQIRSLELEDPRLGIGYDVTVTSRRLGEDTGRDLLVDLGGQLRAIREAQRHSIREPTPTELEKVKEIQRAIDESRR